MNLLDTNETPEQILRKAHVKLMRDKRTVPFIGSLMLGDSSVEYDEKKMPTACTDGFNKIYGSNWLKSCKTIQKVMGGVMHENLHVHLKHIMRHMDLMKSDPMLTNAAMDFVANDIIMQWKEADPSFIDLPDGGLWDVKFRNWSVREVYHYLKTGQDNQGNKSKGGPREGSKPGTIVINGQEYSLGGHDEHDITGLANATPEQIQKISNAIDDAIHQGGILAGRMGMEVPRALTEAMEPQINWADEMMEFVSAHTRGTDEYSYRKFNKHRWVDDLYLPSTVNERIEEVIAAIDTSGSIGIEQLSDFANELAGICERACPEQLRVIWWDAAVAGEQVFTEQQFNDIRSLLKPAGGGGTCVGCVSKYILDKGLTADCLVVLTDGYTEDPIKWEIEIPTLWVITQNKNFNAPSGRKIEYKKAE